MDALQHWETLLANRGILGAAKTFGWKPGTYASQGGWLYPVFDEIGKAITTRFKNFDSSTKSYKYSWPDGQPDGCVYYLLPGSVEAMHKAGVAIIASGEPDALAYYSAGAKNVFCWFGETRTPATLAADLKSFGVTGVEFAPDRDDAGTRWAQSIVNALDGSGIHTRIYELIAPMGSKFDINRLWIDCKFDADTFWDVVACQCKELSLEPDLKVDKRLPMIRPTESTDFPPEYYEAIARALGVQKYKTNGYSDPVKCPFHDDEHASAGWHATKHILKCMVCHGDKDWALAKEVAEQFNIHLEDFTTHKPPVVKQTAPRQEPAGKPKLVYSWDEATDKLLAQLDGDVPVHEPLPMPFKAIANLGGFAKRMGPGKLIAIVGDSGMGKTSLIETIVDFWRKAGFHGVMWGPEWQYSEYVQRAIQRQGGPTYEQMEDHKSYLSEMKRNVPEIHRTGTLLSTFQREQIQNIAAQMKTKWIGKLSFIEKMSLPIEAVIANMSLTVDAYIAGGKRIAFAVLDYAQLVGATGESEIAKLNHILDVFKGFCVDKQLVGIAGSQMTKVDGRAAANGVKGSMHSMVSARTDVFNLAWVVTRAVDDKGNLSQVANNRIVKNSTGRLGDVPLYLNPDRMSWHDVETTNLNDTLNQHLDRKVIEAIPF